MFIYIVVQIHLVKRRQWPLVKTDLYQCKYTIQYSTIQVSIKTRVHMIQSRHGGCWLDYGGGILCRELQVFRRNQ